MTNSVRFSIAIKSCKCPSRTSTPSARMPTRSQISCACASKCDESSTVIPRRFRSRIKSRMSREPAGSTPAVACLAQLDEVEQFVHAILQFCASQSAKTPEETKRLLASKKLLEVRILWQKTDRVPALYETTVPPEDFRAATRWRYEAENNLQSGAFTGAIRPSNPYTSPGSMRRLRSFTATIDCR